MGRTREQSSPMVTPAPPCFLVKHFPLNYRDARVTRELFSLRVDALDRGRLKNPITESYRNRGFYFVSASGPVPYVVRSRSDSTAMSSWNTVYIEIIFSRTIRSFFIFIFPEQSPFFVVYVELSYLVHNVANRLSNPSSNEESVRATGFSRV